MQSISNIIQQEIPDIIILAERLTLPPDTGQSTGTYGLITLPDELMQSISNIIQQVIPDIIVLAECFTLPLDKVSHQVHAVR
jgi:hypothetical protein